MQRIVVGVDGSEGAAAAVRWASGLAARTDAELVVMTGFVPTESELPPDRVEALLAEEEEQLETWAEATCPGDVRMRTVVEWGDPRPGILAVAEREDADLVVVGRVGRSAGPGVLHLGSVAEWLAHHSDLPVAVVGGVVGPPARVVLVGVDGSAGSRNAVSWIRHALTSAELRVVAVTTRQPLMEWTPADSEANWRRGVETAIREDYAADLVETGVDVEASALYGSNAATLLLQAAKDNDVDLIVVGARGLGGFSGLRVGGVALSILHQADRPVVLVPAGHGQ